MQINVKYCIVVSNEMFYLSQALLKNNSEKNSKRSV